MQQQKEEWLVEADRADSVSHDADQHDDEPTRGNHHSDTYTGFDPQP